jgi:hypothetical protein
MPADASNVPFPYVDALMVAQTVDRAGIPPGMPGFQVVRRPAGMMAAVAEWAWQREKSAASTTRRDEA